MVLLAGAIFAHAQDDDPRPEPFVLAEVNAEVLATLRAAEVTPSVEDTLQAVLGEVFAEPERLAAVAGRTDVARYWQAHGLLAMHRGDDPEPALRLACVLDKTPVEDVEIPGFYEAFAEACAARQPALVPIDLGELSGISVVWVDGETHGVGQYVRSGQHLVQVTEDGRLVSSRWMKASSTAVPPPPPPDPPEPPAPACSSRCRALRIGGVASLVVAGALTGVAIQAAIVEEELDDDDDEWNTSNEDVVRRARAVTRRNGAAIGAGVAVGLGVTGIVLSGRF